MRGSILKARETAPKTPESDSIKAPLARSKGRIIEGDLATRLLAGWRNVSGTRRRPVGGLCGPCVLRRTQRPSDQTVNLPECLIQAPLITSCKNDKQNVKTTLLKNFMGDFQVAS